MKLVGVSQRVDTLPDRNETRDALDQRLVKWITSCGFIPVPVPNTLQGCIHNWLMNLQPAALILSGGNNIGQHPDRDESELAPSFLRKRIDFASSWNLSWYADDGVLGRSRSSYGQWTYKSSSSIKRPDFWKR